jgi:hypothetical protein
MRAALDACRAAGGLWRWPGGYWVARAKQPNDPTTPSDPNWGTQTVFALIDRGEVTATGHADTFGGGSYVNRVEPARGNRVA